MSPRLARDAVSVRVPATSANLGSGFDTAGLALRLHDRVDVRATTGGVSVRVTGQGEGSVPDGEEHLVVRAIRRTLDVLGAPQVGLELDCHNRIPHSRGLGSSASAVVSGIAAACGLLAGPREAGEGGDLDARAVLSDIDMLGIAQEFEGHPDNAAPAIMGGAVIGWSDPGGVHAERLEVSDELEITVIVPATELRTATARAVLPDLVPRADAVRQLPRAALLPLALGGRTDLLLPATEDWLHQSYRSWTMPETIGLVESLRAEGHAAVVSGAGPSVLVLAGAGGPGPEEHASIASLVQEHVRRPGQWRIAHPAIDPLGVAVW